MTRQEAKKLSLEVWRYLRDHPNIKNKRGLPQELFAKIKDLESQCPLCAVFWCCEDCPLERCTQHYGVYNLWYEAGSDAERRMAATRIVRRIEAWEPEE
jgi:hypothetical protein